MKFKLLICCIGMRPKKLMVFGFTILENVRMLPTSLLRRENLQHPCGSEIRNNEIEKSRMIKNQTSDSNIIEKKGRRAYPLIGFDIESVKSDMRGCD